MTSSQQLQLQNDSPSNSNSNSSNKKEAADADSSSRSHLSVAGSRRTGSIVGLMILLLSLGFVAFVVASTLLLHDHDHDVGSSSSSSSSSIFLDNNNNNSNNQRNRRNLFSDFQEKKKQKQIEKQNKQLEKEEKLNKNKKNNNNGKQQQQNNNNSNNNNGNNSNNNNKNNGNNNNNNNNNKNNQQQQINKQQQIQKRKEANARNNNNNNQQQRKHSFAETVVQKEHPVFVTQKGGSNMVTKATSSTTTTNNQNNNNNNNNNNNGSNNVDDYYGGNVKNGNGPNNNNNNKKKKNKVFKTATDFGSTTKTFDLYTPPKPLFDNDMPGRKLYRRRGKPMTDDERSEMIDTWGSWTFVDTRKRLSTDIYKKYPNRDIPRDKFPNNAWQTDTEYLSKFLPESLSLIIRAQDAILAEYGLDRDTVKDTILTEIISEEKYEKSSDVQVMKRGKRESMDRGGFTTTNSWLGLKRRLLHAIMTEDSFIFAMGGHSSAAGHGNHFIQSYTLQVQWILESIFARLGIQHESRNFGNGGLGTLHNGLAAASIYGPDIDMLMWDSGMTAGQDDAAVAARQQIMVGSKVPVIWTLANKMAYELHVQADVDIGVVGNGDNFIPKGSSLEKIEKEMPWAVQYVRCSNDLFNECRNKEYIGKCWIDRDDVTPTKEQKKEPGGRAKWHPGNRKHQVKGRIIAYNILEALKQALEQWNTAENYELPDNAWHMTERYNSVRSKILDNTKFKGQCKFDKYKMQYICYTPFQGRTEFTPRAYPYHSSIRQLMPKEMLEFINVPKESIYWPPDVYNPSLHPPAGAIDVLNIVEAGVDFRDVLVPDYTTDHYKKPTFANPPKVPIGRGVQLDTRPGDMYCDGSVDSWCNKGPSADCLLYGHNDGRNGLLFNSYSGWIVMNLPDVKNGFINVKVETWHNAFDMWKTANWTTINGEDADETGVQRQRHLSSSSLSLKKEWHYWNDTIADSSLDHEISTTTSIAGGVNNNNNNSSTIIQQQQQQRQLKTKKVEKEPCDGEFHFEYAVDGVISRYNETETFEQIQQIQRVVQIMPILQDPAYTNGQEKEVEIAIRMVGACHNTAWKLNHVYWS